MSGNLRESEHEADGGADGREARMAMIIYGIYAINLAVPGPFGFIGVALAYLNRGDVRGTWLESHYRWQIRTFWMGIAWAVIGVLTLIILVGWVILALLWVWWAIRIAIGWSHLAKGRAVAKPETWFF